MASDPTDTGEEDISIQIANQLITIANGHLEKGIHPEAIASGFRHAAANFTAFAFFQNENPTRDPNVPVEEFITRFEYYLSAHKPKSELNDRGIMSLIEQAKNEVKN